MATIFQVTELYQTILELLKPLGKGIFGRGENGFLGNGGDLGLDNTRSDNGRFFYTGLGSEQRFGGYVPEKIRGNRNTRNMGGIRSVGGVHDAGGILNMSGGLGASGALGVGGILDAGSALDVNGMGGARNVRNTWSDLNARNDRNRGKESTSEALTDAKAINAVSAANEQNALGYRLGEVLNKQWNSKRILGADILAPIDRSWQITRRRVSVTEGTSGSREEQNGFFQIIKTGGVWGTQNAFPENKIEDGSEKLKNAFSPKKATASELGGFEENAEKLAAVRGFAGREPSGAAAGFGGAEVHLDMSGMRNIVSGGCDTDTLVDMLCGAFREAAFSMSEGVHY